MSDGGARGGGADGLPGATRAGGGSGRWINLPAIGERRQRTVVTLRLLRLRLQSRMSDATY